MLTCITCSILNTITDAIWVNLEIVKLTTGLPAFYWNTAEKSEYQPIHSGESLITWLFRGSFVSRKISTTTARVVKFIAIILKTNVLQVTYQRIRKAAKRAGLFDLNQWLKSWFKSSQKIKQEVQGPWRSAWHLQLVWQIAIFCRLILNIHEI